MSKPHTYIRTAAALGVAGAAFALAQPAFAQMSAGEIETLPGDLRSAPAQTSGSETIMSDDGVETIIRTRRIEAPAPPQTTYPGGPVQHTPVYRQAYAPTGMVVERDAWIAECERRTSGYRDKEKGGIIGSLLGAIGGGILGNQVAGTGDRLGGTLIGAGVGGLGGLLLGNLIGGGKKEGRYDCEAALDGYMSQYGNGHPRIAARTIPAPAYGYGYAQPAYAAPMQYGYAQQGCNCGYPVQQQQQIMYVPVERVQRQRVIVRETVREETYEVPGAARTIPAPAPSPKMIKQVRPVPRATPAPRPIKMIKQ